MDEPTSSAHAATIATTEHFTLQAARAATVTESNGRANLFLGAVSSGLVALAFVGQVSGLDTGFLTFGLVVLPVLLFIGLVTFDRVLQSAVEDFSYAQRINDVRRFYLAAAPELGEYLLAPAERGTAAVMTTMGLRPGRLQPFLTAAGMVEVLNAALAGAIVAFAVSTIDRDQAALAIVAGLVVGALLLTVLHRAQRRVWTRATGDTTP
ncbi:MAG: hypothetical protein ACR2HP_15505 [Ilumatobacteraceae bacterium]